MCSSIRTVVARSSETIADRSCDRVQSASCFSGRLLMMGSAARVSRGGSTSPSMSRLGFRKCAERAQRGRWLEICGTERGFVDGARAAHTYAHLVSERRVAEDRDRKAVKKNRRQDPTNSFAPSPATRAWPAVCEETAA